MVLSSIISMHIQCFSLDMVLIRSERYNIQFCASRDYYKENNIRIPMSLPSARALAKSKGYTLPTKIMVDLIWKNADLKLEPITIPPSKNMSTMKTIKHHNDMIDAQIGNRHYKLIAGIKKDILQSNSKYRVTIYGWHRLDGIPIQPVSNVHRSSYFDYSHGVRFIKILK